MNQSVVNLSRVAEKGQMWEVIGKCGSSVDLFSSEERSRCHEYTHAFDGSFHNVKLHRRQGMFNAGKSHTLTIEVGGWPISSPKHWWEE